MVWSQEEIDAYKARRASNEGDVGRVDDWASSGQDPVSPRKSQTGAKKWAPTPTDDNKRADDWLGSSPVGKKRSWKVKSIKTVIPGPDADVEK
jgi:hypothetical protein